MDGDGPDLNSYSGGFEGTIAAISGDRRRLSCCLSIFCFLLLGFWLGGEGFNVSFDRERHVSLLKSAGSNQLCRIYSGKNKSSGRPCFGGVADSEWLLRGSGSSVVNLVF